jgi:hypothetical protein
LINKINETNVFGSTLIIASRMWAIDIENLTTHDVGRVVATKTLTTIRMPTNRKPISRSHFACIRANGTLKFLLVGWISVVDDNGLLVRTIVCLAAGFGGADSLTCGDVQALIHVAFYLNNWKYLSAKWAL